MAGQQKTGPLWQPLGREDVFNEGEVINGEDGIEESAIGGEKRENPIG